MRETTNETNSATTHGNRLCRADAAKQQQQQQQQQQRQQQFDNSCCSLVALID
jgi:hypothetical protein